MISRVCVLARSTGFSRNPRAFPLPDSASKHLISTLFDSVDADKNRELAASKFSVTPDQVTDTQLDEIEALQVRTALLPFHNPQLREILLRPEHQVIDKFTRDQLLTSRFDPEAKKRAESLVTSFRQFIEDNQAEVEAISILYSSPRRKT